MKKLSLLFMVVLLFSCSKDSTTEQQQSSTVTDIDGNIYTAVTIGTQTWMIENLKVTKYRNGELISNVTDNTAWYNLTAGAYCNYNNEVSNAATYGRLYNWYAVSDSRKIAPLGWHIPTDAEWGILIGYIGGDRLAGKKLKSETGWADINIGANETGFTALPGGLRWEYNATFQYMNTVSFFWSGTGIGNSGYAYYLANPSAFSSRGEYDKYDGLSVRCIKD